MSRKGKEKVIYPMRNENAQIQPLRDRNIGIVIHDERDQNVIHTHEDIPRKEAMARKGKATHVCSGKENSQAEAGNVISKVALAQRARRERERILKQGTARLGQRLPGDWVPAPIQIDVRRHYLGKMDIECPHCKALHWMDERLARSSRSSPFFGTCCLQGKVRLHKLIPPPPPLQALYDGIDERSKSFRANSREYNAANAFTSLRAKFNPNVLNGRGPTSFIIHGESRHRTGSLLPQQGQDASYTQLYIYDPTSALNTRTRRNPQLRRDLLQTIQECLLQVNPFVEKFIQAHALLTQLAETGQNLLAHLHYCSSTDRRRYSLPTADEIAIVIPGDGTKASGMRDIILHLRESLDDIRSRARQERSTLTGFFEWYTKNENAIPYTYQEFPQHFVWIETTKKWKPRERGYAIGRMYFASPNSACAARGLLEDDEEWVQCLEEAAVIKTGYQLRRLFSVILTQCSPQQPMELWKRFWVHICDDLGHKIRTLFSISNPTEAQIEDYGLFLLNQLLQESVVPKGVREDIVNASLRCSALWNDMRVLTLDLNMRLNITCPGNATFANFLMEVGTKPQEVVQLPSNIRKCLDLNEMLSAVYPQLNVSSTSTPAFLTERIILSARNDDVNSINGAALNVYPGSVYTYLAADKMCEDDEIDDSITNRYPNEYLNSLDPPGLPLFKLELKVGSPIILLRKIAPKDGLCNGTRMMVVRCASHIIEVKILTGEKFGTSAFIPRISLSPSSSKFPFQMTRRQFPIRLAYAMTINKSQRQSVKFVGIDLRIPVFSHGQLYVALSRCTSFDRISVLLLKDEMNTTTNIVYPEVLL
ncbi:hypothetical protein RHGRI_033922 [Rhododendron griersonianum]|uniref:DNA helicase Pif1-like 2B domain-containing protein n=1 Tax=Rhododendron griersonianum TaxID=479676 RepID=A0AAV6I4E7_9ERIC|nr:hypothetical protein RHGRI_033922 [Rhododendron griersonianum]